MSEIAGGDSEEFRRAALIKLQQSTSAKAGDYECGLNCKPMAGDPTMNICDKTKR